LQAYARTMRTLAYSSNSSFITPTKYTIFIHYIYLLCFAYMFRCYIHHHQGERMRPLLKNMRCYAVIICGYYKSCRKLQKVQLFIY